MGAARNFDPGPAAPLQGAFGAAAEPWFGWASPAPGSPSGPLGAPWSNPQDSAPTQLEEQQQRLWKWSAEVAVVPRCKCGQPMVFLGKGRDDGWACDGYEDFGVCKSGVTDFFQTARMDRYSCEKCEYDLCTRCAQAKQDAEQQRLTQESDDVVLLPRSVVERLRTVHLLQLGELSYLRREAEEMRQWPQQRHELQQRITACKEQQADLASQAGFAAEEVETHRAEIVQLRSEIAELEREEREGLWNQPNIELDTEKSGCDSDAYWGKVAYLEFSIKNGNFRGLNSAEAAALITGPVQKNIARCFDYCQKNICVSTLDEDRVAVHIMLPTDLRGLRYANESLENDLRDRYEELMRTEELRDRIHGCLRGYASVKHFPKLEVCKLFPMHFLDCLVTTVPEGIKKLGMKHTGQLPGVIICPTVYKDSWAESVKITAGDALLFIAGEPVSDLDNSAMDEKMRLMRPLCLVLCKPPNEELAKFLQDLPDGPIQGWWTIRKEGTHTTNDKVPKDSDKDRMNPEQDRLEFVIVDDDEPKPPTKAGLTAFDYFDRNKDGLISREEFHIAFDVLDRNRDGVLSREELQQGLLSMAAPMREETGIRDGRTEHHSRAEFESLDRNHDGVITREEFEQGNVTFDTSDRNMHGVIPKDELQKMQWEFDALDRNRDGVISRDELLQGSHLLNMSHKEERVVNSIQKYQQQPDFDFVDKNHDGVITREEYEHGRLAFDARQRQWRRVQFDVLDSNKDGVITQDEFQQGHATDEDLDHGRSGYVLQDELLRASSAFDTLDRDKDGVITRDEFMAATRDDQMATAGSGRGADSAAVAAAEAAAAAAQAAAAQADMVRAAVERLESRLGTLSTSVNHAPGIWHKEPPGAEEDIQDEEGGETPIEGDTEPAIGEWVIIQVPEGVEDLGFAWSRDWEERFWAVDIQPGGFGAQGGLQLWDELVSVDDAQVKDMAQDELEKCIATGPKPIQLTFWRFSDLGNTDQDYEQQAPADLSHIDVNPLLASGDGKDAGIAQDESQDAERPPVEETPALEQFILPVEGPRVARLGFTFTGPAAAGKLPEMVTIETIEEDSWSQYVGLLVGDVIVSVNGQAPGGVSKDEFESMLKRRPIEIVLARDPSVGPPPDPVQGQSFFVRAGIDDVDLGFTPLGTPPNDRVMVKTVAKGSWSQAMGIFQGDELTAVGDVEVYHMKSGNLQELLQARPLYLLFASEAGAGTAPLVPQDAVGLLARASEGDTPLGFTLHGGPPGFFYIKDLATASWGAQAGLANNDALLAVNGQAVANMSMEAVNSLMEVRPLEVVVAHWGPWEEDAPEETEQPAHTDEEPQEDGPAGHGETVEQQPPVVAQDPGEEHTQEEPTPDQGPEPDEEGPAEDPIGELQSNEYEVLMDETIGDPGFAPITPLLDLSKEVEVGSVTPGGWAEQSNIRVGDKVIWIGGRNVEGMSKAEVKQAIGKQRPLRLRLIRVTASTDADASPSGVDEGGPQLVPEEPPPDEEPKPDVAPDEEPKPDVAPEAQSELGWSILGDTEQGTLDVTAEEDVVTLGFKLNPDGIPPNPVCVKSVDDGSWAASKGIKEGYTILSINGEFVAGFTKKMLKDAIRSRPVQISFTRGDADSGQAAAWGFEEDDPNAPHKDEPSKKAKLIDMYVDESEKGKLGFDHEGDSTAAVIVTFVTEGGLADLSGVKVGDELLEINDEASSKIKNIKKALKARPLHLKFERDKKQQKERAKAKEQASAGWGLPWG